MFSKLLRFFVPLQLALCGCGSGGSEWNLHNGETAAEQAAQQSAPQDPRRRVLISTDIGGDNDDTQSLIHALLYSDEIRIEGIVCSVPTGNCSEALDVIERYEADYPTLLTHSTAYPPPDYFRGIVTRGAVEPAPDAGFTVPSDGSQHIVQAALRTDDHLLIVVVWGSLTDVAQAVHDAPQIKPRLQVYSIGGYNTRQDPNAFNYLRTAHPDLLWIHSETTNQGIYLAGLNDETRYGNIGFVREVVRPAGNLGSMFYDVSEEIDVNQFGIKMGDTPSFLFALRGDFDSPWEESWGGKFCHQGGLFYSDCPDEKLALRGRAGAQTVADFREEFLTDFEERLARLSGPPA